MMLLTVGVFLVFGSAYSAVLWQTGFEVDGEFGGYSTTYQNPNAVNSYTGEKVTSYPGFIGGQPAENSNEPLKWIGWYPVDIPDTPLLAEKIITGNPLTKDFVYSGTQALRITHFRRKVRKPLEANIFNNYFRVFYKPLGGSLSGAKFNDKDTMQLIGFSKDDATYTEAIGLYFVGTGAGETKTGKICAVKHKQGTQDPANLTEIGTFTYDSWYEVVLHPFRGENGNTWLEVWVNKPDEEINNRLLHAFFDTGTTNNTFKNIVLGNLSPNFLPFGKGNGIYDDLEIAEEYRGIDVAPPQAPLISVSRKLGEVELIWEKSIDENKQDVFFAEKVGYYRIYRGTSSSFTPSDPGVALLGEVPVVELGENEKYTFVDVPPTNDEYFYAITALTLLKHEGDASTAVASGKAYALRGVVKGSDNISLDEATIELIGQTGSIDNIIVDTNGIFLINLLPPGEYNLRVRALKYKQKSFPVTIIDTGEDQPQTIECLLDYDDENPPPPTELEVTVGIGYIDLSWQEPEEDPQDEYSYRIYRTNVFVDVPLDKDLIFITEVGTTNWRDLVQKDQYGKPFFYYVYAVDLAGNVSDSYVGTVEAVTVKIPATPKLVSPLNAEVTTNGIVTFRWEHDAQNPLALPAQDLSGYKLIVSQNPSFPSKETLTVSLGTVEEWTAVEPFGEGYWYWKVIPTYETGIESYTSSVAEFASTYTSTNVAPYLNVVPQVLTDEAVVVCFVINPGVASTLRVYRVDGKPITELQPVAKGDNVYECSWDGKDRQNQKLSNGLYIVQLEVCGPEVGRVRLTRKLVINR